MSASPSTSSEQQTDSADLARFGYQQELKRGLGLFSTWAVCCSLEVLGLALIRWSSRRGPAQNEA